MYVRPKSRGKWQCVWEVPDPLTGDRRRVTEIVYGTKAEAEARWVSREAALLHEGARPRPDRSPDWTVAGWCAHWLAEVAEIRPSTGERYARLLRRQIAPVLGDVTLAALHPSQLQAAERRWIREGLAPSTVRQAHSLLRAAYAQAVAWDLCPTNPVLAVLRPRLAAPALTVWTPAERSRFWAVARQHRHGSLFGLVLQTGLRQSEALGLQWADVDLDGAALLVHQQLLRRPGPDGERFAPFLKTQARRRVDLDAQTVLLLRQERATQKRERLAAGPAYQDYTLVCCTGRGTPFAHRNVVRLLKALEHKAGVPAIRFHDLRHTHASVLIAAGADPRLVADRLGHRSVAFTLQIYGHLWAGRQAEVIRRLPPLPVD